MLGLEQAVETVAPPEPRAPDRGDVELTVLMPCLNEALTLATCIDKARQFMARVGIVGEVVIADNGSTDGSIEIAKAHGARVVHVQKRGYGAALIAGIESARGRFVIMGDSDDSYDFSALQPFVDQLRQGCDLVMGNRFRGGIRPGAMPALHRYLGNPVLSFVGRLFFGTPVRDFHCGLRGFRRDAILALGLRCEGMEFASEMIVKASLRKLSIVEVPTTLSPDGRDRPPHLRSWRDGWRHLRFLMLFSPRWLFLYPGVALLCGGLVAMLALMPGPLTLAGLTFDVHTLLYAGGATVAGLQLLMFAVFAKVFSVESGILPGSRYVTTLRRYVSLEAGLIVGLVLLLAGLGMTVYSVVEWERARYGAFDPIRGMRIVVPALTVTLIGIQTLFASLFLGVLDLKVHSVSR